MATLVGPESVHGFRLYPVSESAPAPSGVSRAARGRCVGPPLGRLFRFLESCASATVVTRITRRMADAGLRRVVPSDLYPLVLGFLRDNQLSSVANKFVKATGAVSPGLGSWAGVGSPQGCGPWHA